MAIAFKRLFKISTVKRLRIKTVIFIAIFWTAIDFVILIMRTDTPVRENSIWFREALMFGVSLIMGYLFVFRLKKMLRNYPLWINFLIKSFILLGSAFLITFIIQLFNSVVLNKETPEAAYHAMINYALKKNWLLQKIVYWISIFFVTQLILIINEKYSPGVFFDILSGRYIHPQIENRIVMFIDLKDSTPIAEKLGHSLYFEFIREFIYQISLCHYRI